MVERLKRWESPRKRGRNDKGKGGSARARQLRKREQMLRQKLKRNQNEQNKPQGDRGRDNVPSLFFVYFLRNKQRAIGVWYTYTLGQS